ncbi:MAG: hypothetical protein AB7T63_03960 [Planctomycetota bacterium]
MSMPPASLRTFAFAGLVAFLLPACGDDRHAERVREEAAETWDAIRTLTIDRKDDAMRLIDARKKELDASWEEAKQDAATWSDEAREDLESGWQRVSDSYDAVRQATKENWVETRDAFVAAYEAFKRSLQNEP